LKIGTSKIDPKVSWEKTLHFKWEYVGVGFANKLQLGVVTIEEGWLKSVSKRVDSRHMFIAQCPTQRHSYNGMALENLPIQFWPCMDFSYVIFSILY